MIIDGNFHRLDVTGKRIGNKAGSYIAFLEEYNGKFYLNAYIRDFYRNTGEKYNSKNFNELDNLNYHKLQKQFYDKRTEKQLYLEKKRDIIRKSFEDKLKNYPKVKSHKYLSDKKLDLNSIVAEDLPFTDDSGNLVLQITRPSDFKLEGLQTINPNGFKHLEKYSSIKGNCIFLNSKNSQDKYSDLIFLSTGYSTSLSIQNAMKHSVYACISDTNALSLARNLINLYPNKEIIFFADNDLKTEIKMRKSGHPNPINSGLEIAKKLNEELGIKSIIPNLDYRYTDFSDFLFLYGKEELEKFIDLNINLLKESKMIEQEYVDFTEEEIIEQASKEKPAFQKSAPLGKDGRYTKEQLEEFYGSKDRTIKKIAEQAINNNALFQKSLRAGEVQMPRNLINGRDYSGSNALALIHANPNAEAWITRKQSEKTPHPITKAEKEGEVVFVAVQKNGKTFFNSVAVFDVTEMRDRKAKEIEPIVVDNREVVQSFNRIVSSVEKGREIIPLDIDTTSQDEVAYSLNGLIKAQVVEECKSISIPSMQLDEADQALATNFASLITAVKHGLPYIPPRINEQLAKRVQDRLEKMAENPSMFKNITKVYTKVVNKIEKDLDKTRSNEYDKAIGLDKTKEKSRSKSQGMER